MSAARPPSVTRSSLWTADSRKSNDRIDDDTESDDSLFGPLVSKGPFRLKTRNRFHYVAVNTLRRGHKYWPPLPEFAWSS